MTRRTICGAFSAVMLLAIASAATAQANSLVSMMSETSFGPAEEARIRAGLEELVNDLVTGDQDKVNAARKRLIEVATDGRATAEFRAAAAKVITTMLAEKLPQALALRHRLAVAIVVARMQNPESVPVLLKLLGEGEKGEPHAAVRYWAAKGLAGDEAGGEKMKKIIREESSGVSLRVMLEKLGEALDREREPICAAALFSVVEGIETEPATDLLIDAVAKAARKFDLGQGDAADAMQAAAAGLRKAFVRERRPPGRGKQRIVSTLVQVLARTPPRLSSFGLLTQLDEALAEMTQEKTGLAAVIKECSDQVKLTEPKLIDIIWLQQLSWIEVLLKTENKDVRLLSRPEILEWTPENSVKVVREAAKQP